jgi:hypothetical protein
MEKLLGVTTRRRSLSSPLVAFPLLAFSDFFAINDDVLGRDDAEVNFIAFDGEYDHLDGIADTDHLIFSSR